MKQELPIAVVLLAAGVFLWLSQGTNNFWHSQPSSQDLQAHAANTQSDSWQAVAQNNPGTNSVAWASFEEDANATSATADVDAKVAPQNSAASSSTEAISVVNDLISKSDPVSINLLTKTGSQLRQHAFKTQIEVQLNWLDEVHYIKGDYRQVGQGSGHSRMTLQSETQAGPITITKICDGRFLYTQLSKPAEVSNSQNQSNPNSQSLEFVDLKKVTEVRIHSGLDEPGNPMGWISTGGLASLMENLSSAFEFSPIESNTQSGTQISTIHGTWNREKLKELLGLTVEPEALEPKIDWSRLPAQVPHAIRLSFVEHESFGQFPSEVSFLQIETRQSTEYLRPLVTVQFTAPESLTTEELNMLKLEIEGVETLDATAQYIDQVRDFEFAREAALDKVLR